MQLRLSNLYADHPFVKVWGLLPLSTTVGGKVEKPVKYNWPPPFVIRRQLCHWIARIMVR